MQEERYFTDVNGLFSATFKSGNNPKSRSQWPRGLRRRSAAARLLRSWVRIPPGAWMSVCCDCCVLSGRGLCDELITHPEESYQLWCVVASDLENLKTEEAMTRAGSQHHSNIYIYIYIYIYNSIVACSVTSANNNQTNQKLLFDQLPVAYLVQHVPNFMDLGAPLLL